MVTAAKQFVREPARYEWIPASCRWRLVQHFDTVEEAEHCVDALRHDGIDARVTLLDGLSVVAPSESFPSDGRECDEDCHTSSDS